MVDFYEEPHVVYLEFDGKRKVDKLPLLSMNFAATRLQKYFRKKKNNLRSEDLKSLRNESTDTNNEFLQILSL